MWSEFIHKLGCALCKSVEKSCGQDLSMLCWDVQNTDSLMSGFSCWLAEVHMWV